jgi:dihydrofolate reductase
MGRLVMSLNVTLDACCDHSHVVADDDLHRYALDMLLASNGVLLGRVTYELFETFWPLVASGAATGTEAELAFARELDRTPKHVVTHRLDSVGWANSSTVKGDLVGKVSELKAAGDLVMFGSPGLAMALAQHRCLTGAQVEAIVRDCGCPLVLEGVSSARECTDERSQHLWHWPPVATSCPNFGQRLTNGRSAVNTTRPGQVR